VTTVDGSSTADLLEAAVTEYGGRPYGLEPLLLPVYPVHGDGDGGDVELTERYPELLGTGTGGESSSELRAPDSAEQLFWFRWITGHQLTFVLWQELGRRAAEASVAQDSRDGVPSAARLVRGYSAMLLYTASCTRDVYHRVIRPSMALHHPGFTGAWARDYGPVRTLLRGRLPAAWSGGADALLHESTLNDAVHEGIAGKLVPAAPSLLQSAADNGRILPRDVRAVLFDTYFLTLRAPSTPSEVTAQLLRRVRAVRDDLRTNGLYPDFASSRHEKPDVLAAPGIEEIERAIPHVLSVIARDAVRHRVPVPASEWLREGAGSHGT
jgi:hypothetical protein